MELSMLIFVCEYTVFDFQKILLSNYLWKSFNENELYMPIRDFSKNISLFRDLLYSLRDLYSLCN